MKQTKTKKAVKNTKKFDFIVDMRTYNTADDVYNAFTDAKVYAGLPISEEEWDRELLAAFTAGFNANLLFVLGDLVCANATCVKKEEKKQPWYKRIFNWFKKK